LNLRVNSPFRRQGVLQRRRFAAPKTNVQTITWPPERPASASSLYLAVTKQHEHQIARKTAYALQMRDIVLKFTPQRELVL
jgi:hypothetical protein